MNVLGSFGNLYMAALLILLVAGFLFAIHYLVIKTVTLLTGKDQQKGRSTTKTKSGGDSIMKNSNGWLKLAIISFVGLMISVVLLNVTNPTNANTTISTTDHSSHVAGTATVGGMVQGTVNSGVSMDQMNNIMQQMSQLQQQMMQMQQQFVGQQGSSMGSTSTGSMGSSGNGMGMNQMNPSNQMNNSNSTNSNSSSSGGGMGMM